MSGGMRALLALLVVLVLVLVLGPAQCGPSNGLNLAPVRGRVTYEGEPVHWGNVLFIPDASRGTEGPPALGLISLEGVYSMASEGADDGVIVGTHKVGIVGLEPLPTNADVVPLNAREIVAAKAAKVREQLKGRGRSKPKPRPDKAEGKAGEEKKRTMTLVDGRTYEIVVPDKVLTPDSSGILVEVKRGSNTINFDVKKDGTVAITR